jgi:membrane protein implicated in regulation of membrane protease activity
MNRGEQKMLQEPLFWLGLFLILVVLEVLITNHVYLILFSIGALVTGFVAFFISSTYILLSIFIIVSLIVTFTIRTPLERFFESKKLGRLSNIDTIIGKRAIVTKPILPNAKGYVEIENEEWLAVSRIGNAIEEGTEVEVLAIEGITLTVSLLHTKVSEL